MSELEYTEQGWRYTTDTSRHHRTNGWDYSGVGIYHMTLVVAARYSLFGELAGGSTNEAYIELNDFGQQVNRLLHDLPVHYRQKGIALKMLAIQVMPDHIHFAIQVLKPMPRSIGEVVRSIKSTCTAIYKREYYQTATGGNNAAEYNDPAGAQTPPINPPEAVVGFARIFASRGSIWQANVAGYHECILKHRGQLHAMIAYIKANPRRLAMKRANPDLFKIHQQYMLTDVPCTVLGNMFLADYPMHAMVQCSRRLTQAEIDAYRDTCLTAAEQGTIHVSAAISEGEKQTCRALREAGHPLIILLTEGFPKPDSPHYKYYKPSGVYFEACAAGRLLLVEPAAEYFDRPEVEAKVYAKTGIRDLKHDAKRYRFLALNALAEKIASDITA